MNARTTPEPLETFVLSINTGGWSIDVELDENCLNEFARKTSVGKSASIEQVGIFLSGVLSALVNFENEEEEEFRFKDSVEHYVAFYAGKMLGRRQ